LDFIAQFNIDIRHISGQDNIVAETLSRVEVITTPGTHETLAAAQADDEDLDGDFVETTALLLKKFLIPGTSFELYCDISGKTRPYVPSPLPHQILNSLNSLSQPGINL
jgi:hypothetical protein